MKLFSFDWPLRSLVPLSLWEIEYFRHLQAQWYALGLDPASADFIRIVDLERRFEDASNSSLARRSALVELEQCLIRHFSTATLVQLAPIIRLRFHDIVGDRQFAAYRPTALPDCTSDDEKARLILVDDLSSVLATIHWRYVMMPFASRIRISLTLSATFWMLLYTLLWAASIFIAKAVDNPFFAVTSTCLLAGILGGFISALRRMQSIGDDNDSVFVAQGIKAADFWLFFSPLLGGVFALIAMLFCISGLIGGSIFPHFYDPNNLATNAIPCAASPGAWWFKTCLLPKSQDEYAKLFLWCFISGFAERFIPDMLDSLIRRVDQTQKNLPAPISAAAPPSETEGKPQPIALPSVRASVDAVAAEPVPNASDPEWDPKATPGTDGKPDAGPDADPDANPDHRDAGV